MNSEQLNCWYPRQQQDEMVARLIRRVGLTRSRAECFVRLWIHVVVKAYQIRSSTLNPPLKELEIPTIPVECTHREAAELFYNDKDKGSERSAGMMLDKLASLGLITKEFDGNSTQIQIQPLPNILASLETEEPIPLIIDDFNLKGDAIPVAHLLATNYNWMNRNTEESLPQRITRLLRTWAATYSKGMRVLRREDNNHPVGFYLLYPTTGESEAYFFGSPEKGLHISTLAEIDPFVMASPGDHSCTSVFVRSWMIDPDFINTYRIPFVQDSQQVLIQMQQDFPNMCDLYSMIIHPSQEKLGTALGFQRISRDPKTSVCWIYQPIERFLQLDVGQALANYEGTRY